MTPVHHGVTPDSGGDGDSLPPAVKVPYILSVSSFYRYKNYARLVEAFGLLREKVSQEYQLVLVGYPVERDVHEAVNRQIASLGLRDHCLILPGVPYDSLSALYRHASIYVFPSLCESFGLTPLEAMAFGVPTLVSNISAMPEICANGALFFDPYDSADLADKAVAVLQTSSLREDLTKRGRERARRFTWEACARKTLNVFLEVMSRGR
ncbi:MAG: glycosyltransferase family 4 protein [Armatimonadetes bacterium]|nr:glycosyltransferase family 4 protein [Armatimonadota bacterium]